MALDHFRAATAIYEELGAKRELAKTLMQLVGATADVQEALDAAKRSRALYEQLGDAAQVERLDSILDGLAEHA